MKNIKNMFAIVATITLFLTSQSSMASSKEFATKSGGLLKQMQGPGFELFNKASNTITITIFIDGVFTKLFNIQPQGKAQLTVDVKKPIQLGIYNQETKISTTTFTRNITPKPDHSYTLDAPEKTKYLTWNPAKGNAPLYPQTGPLMGLMGKTESGLPLNNNISAKEIIKQ